jgi:hypothetical protein
MQTPTSHSTPNFGLTVRRLLEELDDVFPPVNPTPDTSVGHIMYRAGQRSVVEWIENRLDEES